VREFKYVLPTIQDVQYELLVHVKHAYGQDIHDLVNINA
jgi:hypothetical protein